jgi:WD40 repeat protein
VWLWNVTSPGHPTRIGQPLTGPTSYVFSVAFSPDSRTLAAASPDGGVWLWNVTSPGHPTRIGQPLTGPVGIVLSVAFSPNGRTLAAASSDGGVWVWNVTSPGHPTPIGQPLTGPAGRVDSVAFSPDGRTLAGSSDDMVWLWNPNVSQVIDRICATTSGNLTPGQWTSYIPQLPYDPPCRHR